MIKTDKPTDKSNDAPKTRSQKIIWFIAIWAASVLALGVITYALRFFFHYIYV